MVRLACILAVLSIAVVPCFGATLGFVDTFPGTGTGAWGGGTAVSNPGTGGLGGAGDGYLQLTETVAGKFGTRDSAAAYLGNWTTAGITRVTFYLNDVGIADNFEIHFAIADGSNNTWQYNTGFTPPNGAWQQFSVDMTSGANWTEIIGSASFASVLGSVSKVHFRDDTAPFSQTPPNITGDLGIDNVALVPEPSTIALLALGAVAIVWGRRHGLRRRAAA